MAEPLTVPDDLPAITTPEEARAAFGPEARGPNGEPMNLTAYAIDALDFSHMGARVRAIRIGGEVGVEVEDVALTAFSPATVEVV